MHHRDVFLFQFASVAAACFREAPLSHCNTSLFPFECRKGFVRANGERGGEGNSHNSFSFEGAFSLHKFSEGECDIHLGQARPYHLSAHAGLAIFIGSCGYQSSIYISTGGCLGTRSRLPPGDELSDKLTTSVDGASRPCFLYLCVLRTTRGVGGPEFWDMCFLFFSFLVLMRLGGGRVKTCEIGSGCRKV